jgi:hypothetical protein
MRVRSKQVVAGVLALSAADVGSMLGPYNEQVREVGA